MITRSHAGTPELPEIFVQKFRQPAGVAARGRPVQLKLKGAQQGKQFGIRKGHRMVTG